MLSSDLEKERAPIGNFAVENGNIVANSDNIINTKHHSDPDRLRGCCGLSGFDGMNVVCFNDHEVATEQSDCVSSHSITFDRDAVWLDRIWIDESE